MAARRARAGRESTRKPDSLGKQLNQGLSNGKFADKRDHEARGYRASELKITQTLAMPPYDEIAYWELDQIEHRQKLLARTAGKIWKI